MLFSPGKLTMNIPMFTMIFARYPDMAYWPEDHGFFFAKLVPESILLLDQFGGAADISLEDFFGAKTPEEELAVALFSN